jgi:hypothetical protein
MKPIDFKQRTHVLDKPRNMTEEQCSSLPVFKYMNECGFNEVVSCWRPTWRERLSILLFGKIWLGVCGSKTQPPVWLWGNKKGVFDE